MTFSPKAMQTAVFQSDDSPDFTVRVLVDASGPAMSLQTSPTVDPLVVELPATVNMQQLVEALQFAADTFGAQLPGRLSPFVRGWVNVANDSHQNAKDKGFWKDGEERNDAEMIMLVVTELAEAVEGLRAGNPPDDKLPEFSSVEVEFADAIIRMMDHAHARGWRVAQAVETKMKFNATRAHMHGKKF